MRSPFQKADALTLAAFTATAGITAAVYPRLPARMATHFDMHGTPDGWMPRETGAWVLLPVAFAVWVTTRYLPVLLPSGWRARAEASPIAVASLFVALFFCVIQAMVLDGALHGTARTTRILPWAIGALLIGLSQILPRTRRNPLLGVRTTWTLTSDEIWLRTHRLAGYAFFFGGLVSVVAGGIGGAQAIAVSIAATLTAALVPVAYSYYLARTLHEDR